MRATEDLHPVSGCSNGSTFCPHRKGVDFGRVKPRYTLETNAELTSVSYVLIHLTYGILTKT